MWGGEDFQSLETEICGQCSLTDSGTFSQGTQIALRATEESRKIPTLSSSLALIFRCAPSGLNLTERQIARDSLEFLQGRSLGRGNGRA